MPVISMFYGVIISLYFLDSKEHKAAHIHARYQDEEVVVSIPDGVVLSGKLTPAKLKLVQAWIEIHKDDLMADWHLAASGQEVFRIEPLK
ncbi:MAG: DUF4160 domain-containing protein [Candidatus Omnitrophica bacterium]|nr:DUF4160 domain-containing protein [Candidatus Omnitrophota bacterium]